MDGIEDLRDKWNYLYRSKLPALAKARSPAQKHWPVFLDHCFARIVLDNAVGISKPWTEVVKSPAVKNLSEQQLESAVALAEKLVHGEADLQELDERSLELRGKMSKAGKKRKAGFEQSENMRTKVVQKKREFDGSISKYFMPSPDALQKESKLEDPSANQKPNAGDTEPLQDALPNLDMSVQLARISSSTALTPFRKQMLSMLCQVPRGRYSTYQAMSDFITASSHKTCARAVGSAMRNNPFAPDVPCHRILAADGSLGGFGGDWGESGEFASKKHKLLYEEGLRFDSKGKVKGPPFRGFHG